VNLDQLEEHMNRSVGVVTALNPYIGYKNATEIAQEALRTRRSVAELVLEKKLLTKEKLKDILSPDKLTRPAAHAPASRR
jgi:aspartate ammonia-lyase